MVIDGYFWDKATDGWYELFFCHDGLSFLVCRTQFEETAKRIAEALTPAPEYRNPPPPADHGSVVRKNL